MFYFCFVFYYDTIYFSFDPLFTEQLKKVNLLVLNLLNSIIATAKTLDQVLIISRVLLKGHLLKANLLDLNLKSSVM